jgi:glutaminase
MKHVLGINPAACRLFGEFFATMQARKPAWLRFANLTAVSQLVTWLLHREHNGEFAAPDAAAVIFPDIDAALEACENALINRLLPDRAPAATVSLIDQELCVGFSTEDIAALEQLLECRTYQAGEVIIKKGTPAEAIFFLMRGEVHAIIHLPSGKQKRIAAFSPGVVFGEIAMADRLTTTADVVATQDAECLVLTEATLHDIPFRSAADAQMHARLLSNMSFILARKLRKANNEIGMLSQ